MIFKKKEEKEITSKQVSNMAKITLSESQLRSIIEEAVNNELQRVDEGFFDTMKNMGRAIGGAFRGDAQRAGNAMAGAGRSMMNGVGNAGRAIGNAGRAAGRAVGNAGRAVGNAVGNAGRAVGNAANNAMQYGKDRVESIKGQYNAYQDYSKIENLLNTINELQADGVLHGPKMEQAIAVITSQLKGAMSRSKGRATSYRN